MRRAERGRIERASALRPHILSRQASQPWQLAARKCAVLFFPKGLAMIDKIAVGFLLYAGDAFKAALITLAWSVVIVLLLTHASATFPAAVARKAKP